MDQLFIALHQAALESPGGISELARRLGKRVQPFINKLNPQDDMHQPSVGEFVAIMQATNNTEALDELCRLFNGQFATRSRECNDSLVGAVLYAITQGGDVCRVIDEALSDGCIDASEMNAINRHIHEARNALTVLENTVSRLSA